ncbi:MAG TPA: primosomal replication protein N [Methylotenera sp.]|nr:primosomal replication protein N [Methylotenera sp.]HPH04404.1 primosomal replication protein N [Methylotenera sp.]HPM99958.1 primosomal replication protein N [Methylotenera sp.]
MNKLLLQAQVVHIAPLRYTPAGIPLLSVVLQHVSEQVEAGMRRRVACEVNAVILGDLTKVNLQVGAHIQASGFLANRSLKSTQLVMHINQIEIVNMPATS